MLADDELEKSVKLVTLRCGEGEVEAEELEEEEAAFSAKRGCECIGRGAWEGDGFDVKTAFQKGTRYSLGSEKMASMMGHTSLQLSTSEAT